MSDPQPARNSGLRTYLERESLLLAACAMHSSDSQGRQHPETEHPYRGPFQRDRDRILHSAAYRRLSGKMQVFTDEMGDYHRTRLTHTQEVASIARTIGRALRLNEDLIEAMALLHDLGHPPFGHAGEDALDECLGDEDMFSHNRHALTIVVELETRYSTHPGLNLSLEVLEGQQSRIDKSAACEQLLESQVVDAADSATYDAHDTDDAIKLEIVTLDELAELPLIRELLRRVRTQFTALDKELTRMALVHELIDFQVSDLLEQTAGRLESACFESADEARRSGRLVGHSSETAALKRDLEHFLFERVYRNQHVLVGRNRAQARLKELFEFIFKQPDVMPALFLERRARVGLKRAIVEYLAGMTDRFCEQEYNKHFPQSGDQGVV